MLLASSGDNPGVPRKRGLMIKPAPLIYALRHTLHRGFVFRDRLVNKIFCNSGLRRFAAAAAPVVCSIIENRHKPPKPRDNIPRLSWSSWMGSDTRHARNRRGGCAKVIAKERTVLSCDRTVSDNSNRIYSIVDI